MTLTWKAPIDYRGKSIGAYDNEEGAYEAPGSDFDYLALLQGKRYPVDRDIPTLYFADPEKKTSRLDCLWLLGGIPLVSARLAEFLLAQVSADIQTVRPKAIHAAGSKTQLDYLILNAAHAINAIDLEKSDAKADEEGTIIYFKKNPLDGGRHDSARHCQGGTIPGSSCLGNVGGKTYCWRVRYWNRNKLL